MKKKNFYTAAEGKWIDSLGADFRQVFKSWCERFPYRHPRAVRHKARTEQEAKLVVTGQRWKAMMESLRHKMNNVPSAKKKGPVSATDYNREISRAIHVSEAQLAAMEAMKDEGFWNVERGTPYSIDEDEELHGSSTVSRLDAYYGTDYACYTNAQREEVLKDLPEDMDDLIRYLERRMGGKFYMIGAWKDFARGYVVHDTSTSRSAHMSELHSEGAETMRHHFLEYVRSHVGARLDTNVLNAHPCIYGSMDGSYRPLMPRTVRSWIVQNRLILAYFEYYWQFQGGPLPIPWPHEQPGTDATGYLDFGSPRLPPGLKGVAHPDWYDEETTWIWADWILRGQLGHLERNTVFQFVQLDDSREETGYREVLHPAGRLYYGPDTCLFVARMCTCRDEDLVARREVAFQLPLLNITPLYTMFRSDDLKTLWERVRGNGNLETLVEYLVHYEEAYPIKASIALWNSYAARCPHLNPISPSWLDGIEGLGSWWLPEEFYSQDSDVASALSIKSFSVWLRSGAFYHAMSRTYLGGPCGIKWAVMILTRFYWCDRAVKARLRPEYEVRALTDKERNQLQEDVKFVTNAIRESVLQLKWLRSPESDADLPDTSEVIEFSRTVYFQPEERVDSSSVASGTSDEEDEPDVATKASPGPGSSPIGPQEIELESEDDTSEAVKRLSLEADKNEAGKSAKHTARSFSSTGGKVKNHAYVEIMRLNSQMRQSVMTDRMTRARARREAAAEIYELKESESSSDGGEYEQSSSEEGDHDLSDDAVSENAPLITRRLSDAAGQTAEPMLPIETPGAGSSKAQPAKQQAPTVKSPLGGKDRKRARK